MILYSMFAGRGKWQHYITVSLIAVAYFMTFKYYIGIGGVLDPAADSGSWTPAAPDEDATNATCWHTVDEDGKEHKASVIVNSTGRFPQSCLEQLKDEDAIMPLQMLMIFLILVFAFEFIRLRAFHKENRPDRGYFAFGTIGGDEGWKGLNIEDWGAVGHVVVIVLFAVTHQHAKVDTCTACKYDPDLLMYAGLLFAAGTVVQLAFNGKGSTATKLKETDAMDLGLVLPEAILSTAAVVILLMGFVKNSDPAETCPNVNQTLVNNFNGILGLPAALGHLVFLICYSKGSSPTEKRKHYFRGLLALYFLCTVVLLGIYHDDLLCLYEKTALTILIAICVMLGLFNIDMWSQLKAVVGGQSLAGQVTQSGEPPATLVLRPRSTDMAMTRLTTDKGAANDAKSLQFV